MYVRFINRIDIKKTETLSANWAKYVSMWIVTANKNHKKMVKTQCDKQTWIVKSRDKKSCSKDGAGWVFKESLGRIGREGEIVSFIQLSVKGQTSH